MTTTYDSQKNIKSADGWGDENYNSTVEWENYNEYNEIEKINVAGDGVKRHSWIPDGCVEFLTATFEAS